MPGRLSVWFIKHLLLTEAMEKVRVRSQMYSTLRRLSQEGS